MTEPRIIKRVIVGYGVTGESIARFLASRQIAFDVVDTRDNVDASESLLASAEGLGSVVKGATACAELVASADEIYLSPGIGVEEFRAHYKVPAAAKMTGDLDLMMQFANAPVVLVTGSNAKTTVTTLVGEIAREANIAVGVGGNIGRPMLDLIDEACALYVLEISSFQLERVAGLRSKIATVLNVSDDHLDRHQTMAAYAEIKQRVYENAEIVVFNREDPLAQPNTAVLNSSAIKINFGLAKPANDDSASQCAARYCVANIDGIEYIICGDQQLIATSDIPLLGSHNVMNVMAALAIGNALSIDIDVMRRAIKRFHGLPHRCQRVKSIDGVNYINDSKATNVGATLAAIKGLGLTSTSSNQLILIAGGVTKGANFAALAEQLSAIPCKLILIGEGADDIARACAQQTIQRASTMQDAVDCAYQLAKAGDYVMLSPACASLDMYKNYEARGDDFSRCVSRIAEQYAREVRA